MGQFSVEISFSAGSVLGGIQQQRDNPNAPLEQGVQQLGREIEKGVEDVTNEIGKVLRNIFK